MVYPIIADLIFLNITELVSLTSYITPHVKNQYEITLIPQISIHPDKICAFNEIHYDPFKPSRGKMSLPVECYLNPTERIINSSRKAKGKVSKIAERKMKKAIDYLLLMSSPKAGYIPKSGKHFNFRIAFVTFDLPSTQMHSDNEIKEKCWNSMLIELTKYHHVTNYLWRAEKQKNGNIHFHLIIDKFVLYSALRKRWNRIVNKLGYVDRYKENQEQWHSVGFKARPELFIHWPLEKQRKAYLEGVKCSWTSPNSTDIHSIKFINNIKMYVTKYMTKDPTKEKENQSTMPEYQLVEGRIWGCNSNLSDIKGARLTIDSEIDGALKKVIGLTKCHIHQDTYFSIYYIDSKQLAENSPDILFKYFTEYLSEKFNYSSQLYLH